MRKLILTMLTTLDGFFEGPNKDISWHNVNEEFNDFAIEQFKSLDLLLFGRVTYELMASYWSTPEARSDDPIITKIMNSNPKIVFSRTLKKADWHNTKLIKDNVVEEIVKMKKQRGKDMMIFGSSNLALTLIQNDLIDEYRIMINPVVLGNGTLLFHGIKDRLNLKLINTKTFKSGNVLLYYQPRSV